MTEHYKPMEVDKWAKLGYTPVRGLRDKILVRYLRSQRRNMLRFFKRAGLTEFASRMEAIRFGKHLTTREKNARFKKVLDDYAASLSPVSQAAPDTLTREMVLPVAGTTPDVASAGDGGDAPGSVQSDGGVL